ncbi:MAG: hypothetical protein QM808_00290 [Steroidobacteraceae bacterium]
MMLLVGVATGYASTTSSHANWAVDQSSSERDLSMLRCAPRTQVISFDGDTRKKMFPDPNLIGGYTCAIWVTPGPHIIVMRFYNEVALGMRKAKAKSDDVSVSFYAEAGKEYLLRARGSDKNERAVEFDVVPIVRNDE